MRRLTLDDFAIGLQVENGLAALWAGLIIQFSLCRFFCVQLICTISAFHSAWFCISILGRNFLCDGPRVPDYL